MALRRLLLMLPDSTRIPMESGAPGLTPGRGGRGRGRGVAMSGSFVSAASSSCSAVRFEARVFADLVFSAAGRLREAVRRSPRSAPAFLGDDFGGDDALAVVAAGCGGAGPVAAP